MKNKLLIILAIFLAGCMTPKKVTRYLNNHGFEAAQYCAISFPVRDSTIYVPGEKIIRTDTSYVPGDSIPCPAIEPGQPPTKVMCPPAQIVTKTITQHDTTTVIRENTAKTAAFQIQVTQLTSRADAAENGRSNWRKWALWTWGILIVAGGLYFWGKSKTALFNSIISKITDK